MNSYLEKIEEKRKRIKELEEKLKELDITKYNILKELETERGEMSKINIDVSRLYNKKENLEFAVAFSKRKLKKQKKLSILLSIGIFMVGTIVCEGIILNFNPSYLGIRTLFYVLASATIGAGSYLTSTKTDRKFLKNVNFEALELELAEKKELKKEFENKIANIEQKLNDFLKESGYERIMEEISKLNKEIEELEAIRKAAIEELLNDLLEQQELVDKDFSELSPELQESFMDAVLKEIEIGSGRPGRPFRTKIRVPKTTTNLKKER